MDRPISEEPWGVLLAAAMKRLGVTQLAVDVEDLRDTRRMDLDVEDIRVGRDGTALIHLVPMTPEQLVGDPGDEQPEDRG